MSEKGGGSMSASKGKRGFFVKLLCFVLALAVGGALGVGGTLFFQWQALPPPEEVFPIGMSRQPLCGRRAASL